METSAKASVNVEEVSLLYKNQDKKLHSSSKQHVSNELTSDCLHLKGKYHGVFDIFC